MSASLQTPTIGLGEFVQQHTFAVPIHQRDYSWSREYVKQFLDDIERAISDDSSTYFFGLMVFTAESGASRLSVIDGQQRLATTIMLFSAIRNWMVQSQGLAETAARVSERYLGKADLGSGIVEDKITLNTANRDNFSKFVIQSSPISEVVAIAEKLKRSDRNKALLEAIVQVTSYVNEKALTFSSSLQAKDYFVRLIGYIDTRVHVVSLIPGGEDAAYTIFETLNDRGLALAPLDLVKNLLFSRAEKYQKGSLADMQSRWDEMMTVLERTKIKSFLRAYWSSRYGLREGPELFSAFKQKFASPKDAYQASLELRHVADNYAALADSNDAIWSSYEPRVSERVEALSVIGGSQLYPLVLSALERFDPKQLGRLLHLVEVIVVRFQMVARGRPGRMESLGSQVARKVFDKSLTTASEAKLELAEIYPSDEDFRRGFLTMSESDNRTQRYLLRTLEKQRRMAADPAHWDEVVPSSKVTVEHIMPRSLISALKGGLGRDSEKHAEYVHRIGNLCLLGDSNKKLGDANFGEKVGHYAKSKILITSSLSTLKEWTFEEIDNRQTQLADLAVQAWRFQ